MHISMLYKSGFRCIGGSKEVYVARGIEPTSHQFIAPFERYLVSITSLWPRWRTAWGQVSRTAGQLGLRETPVANVSVAAVPGRLLSGGCPGTRRITGDSCISGNDRFRRCGYGIERRAVGIWWNCCCFIFRCATDFRESS